MWTIDFVLSGISILYRWLFFPAILCYIKGTDSEIERMEFQNNFTL